MNREQQLLHDIEKCRELLNQKGQTSSLISEEIIGYSHKLDLLLNEYDYLINKASKRNKATTI
ncbi:aspartyl-phosphate phosphatase Spo0E family protein [Halalkalibacter alkalisediminis]|uniref:Aspartyl-phosphate phosphatase Spo0E family protein n=1 Tax=Halalkalibacter alkalisediminis TaxID=935616 RepID=A0ABV6NJ46_9BACI|nr:aspartyl-phosphate phosphatase Spo0E family protein [Halalkalibacter alkalisediminis]